MLARINLHSSTSILWLTNFGFSMEGSSETQQPNHESKSGDEFSPPPQPLLEAHVIANKTTTWIGALFYHYNGFWCPARLLTAVVNFQRHFQAKHTDIILATMPKSGTTWLKALTFSIVHRDFFPAAQSPLLTSNPHALVPFFEYDVYSTSKPDDDPNNIDLENVQCPRIFSTHIHFNSLPTSILDSKCRIIYICRNPLDQFVSHWIFALENFYDGKKEPPVLDEALELFCQGKSSFGPFWEQMLGYWNASLRDPQKVLFFKYEDLKADPISMVKKIAEFLGLPFTAEEERDGVVEEIVKLCSFENLKNLEVNKKGQTHYSVKHSSFFRKGEIGDWANYVSPSMAERVQKVMEEKLGASGLAFEAFCL